MDLRGPRLACKFNRGLSATSKRLGPIASYRIVTLHWNMSWRILKSRRGRRGGDHTSPPKHQNHAPPTTMNHFSDIEHFAHTFSRKFSSRSLSSCTRERKVQICFSLTKE